MKLIIAIIQPHRLDDVMRELDDKEIYLKTVTNVLGCGRQKGVTEVYRGVKEAGTLLKKVRLEIAVNDNYMKPADRRHREGRADGQHRGRQDLRPAAGGMRAHQERGDGQSRHRIGK